MNFLGPLDFETSGKIDFYSTINKGLRHGLYRASQAIAAADPADAASISDALDRLHDMLKLVSKLGNIESVRIHAFLERVCPDATEAARCDSERQTLAIGALVQLEEEMRHATRQQREDLLATLNANFSGFIGEVLVHLADAELEIMPLLREKASSEELHALQRDIFADLGRDAFVALAQEIVSAVGRRERIAFLSLVQRTAPSAVWPSIWWAVCAQLSEEEQGDFTRVLGVDCAKVGLGQTF